MKKLSFFHTPFKNAPRGCAARGDEVYVEHTARARKCAVSAHFISFMSGKRCQTTFAQGRIRN